MIDLLTLGTDKVRDLMLNVTRNVFNVQWFYLTQQFNFNCNQRTGDSELGLRRWGDVRVRTIFIPESTSQDLGAVVWWGIVIDVVCGELKTVVIPQYIWQICRQTSTDRQLVVGEGIADLEYGVRDVVHHVIN